MAKAGPLVFLEVAVIRHARFRDDVVAAKRPEFVPDTCDARGDYLRC
jgi:hypothetical protein